MNESFYNSLAPEDILKAALYTLNRATVLLRNASLEDSHLKKEMILKLAESIHDVPNLISNWKSHSLNELRISFGSFKKDSWPGSAGLDLLSIFENALKNNYT